MKWRQEYSHPLLILGRASFISDKILSLKKNRTEKVLNDEGILKGDGEVVLFGSAPRVRDAATIGSTNDANSIMVRGSTGSGDFQTRFSQFRKSNE